MSPARPKSGKRGDVQDRGGHSKRDKIKKTNGAQKGTGLVKRKRKPEEVEVAEETGKSELREEGDSENSAEGTELQVTSISYHSKLQIWRHDS